MTTGQFAGLLGFLFTAAWIGFGFGEAILCLLGAGVFAGLLFAVQGFLRGDIDLGELQTRLTGRPSGGEGPAPRTYPRAQ